MSHEFAGAPEEITMTAISGIVSLVGTPSGNRPVGKVTPKEIRHVKYISI